MPQRNCTVILAAGEGKRMKRDLPKALLPVLFKPMLQWVLDAARAAGAGRACVVTGCRHEQVEAWLAEHDPEAETAYQPERLGTGHAVRMASEFIRAHAQGGSVLVLNGDAPFLGAAAIRGALRRHLRDGNAVTLISARLEDPTGYGRVLRSGPEGPVRAIVEQKDASPRELAVREVNSGAYWFRQEDLLQILPEIGNDNAQGEYYLTDAVQLLIRKGRRAGACPAENPDAVLGANDCAQLHRLNALARDAVLGALMRGGVDIPCAEGVVIGPDVTFGRDCCVLPGTILRGHTSVGQGCVLGPGTVLDGCEVGDGARLDAVRGAGVRVAPGARPAPFTALR